MKHYFWIILIASFFNISCEENFSPKTDFKEEFILNCVLKSDSTTHIATFLRTYDVEGFNPQTNIKNPFISGANINIQHKGNTYPFRDTLLPINTKYGELINAYVVNFRPNTFDSVFISAKYDNNILSSKLKIPAAVFTESDPISVGIGNKDELILKWKHREKGVYYYPRLTLSYRKRDNLSNLLTMEVPIGFKEENGKMMPLYSTQIRGTSVTYSYETIEWTILEATKDEEKSNYKIEKLQLELMIIDQFLASYYSSSSGYLDNLSIRLDEANYSNINGGLGIFGSYLIINKTVGFTASYLIRLGFTP